MGWGQENQTQWKETYHQPLRKYAVQLKVLCQYSLQRDPWAKKFKSAVTGYRGEIW